jgi:serine/threonine protein phosphatase PrpC
MPKPQRVPLTSAPPPGPVPENSVLDVEFAQFSDPGKVRGHNEDYLGFVVPSSPARARSHGWLFVLADGVGGHDRGEVASRTAVETLLEAFPRAAASETPVSLLTRLVQSANTRVVEAGLAAGAGRSRMATTLVACLLRHDRAAVAHVGDSRCYRIRGAKAMQITRDHTVTNEQIKLGILSPGEAAEASTRHLLSRSLGNELFVNVEMSEHQLLPGDLLVLCSDGMHNSVAASDMADALGQLPDLDAAARSLVALAKERDGGDNISVQIVRVRSVERVGMYRGRPYKLR